MAHVLRIAAGAMVLAVAATTAASARPDARKMTCQQVQSLIRKERAVVLTTGRHTYDRYVRGDSACYRPEIAWQTTIRTRDTDQCPVLHCINRNLVWPDPLDRW